MLARARARGRRGPREPDADVGIILMPERGHRTNLCRLVRQLKTTGDGARTHICKLRYPHAARSTPLLSEPIARPPSTRPLSFTRPVSQRRLEEERGAHESPHRAPGRGRTGWRRASSIAIWPAPNLFAFSCRYSVLASSAILYRNPSLATGFPTSALFWADTVFSPCLLYFF